MFIAWCFPQTMYCIWLSAFWWVTEMGQNLVSEFKTIFQPSLTKDGHVDVISMKTMKFCYFYRLWIKFSYRSIQNAKEKPYRNNFNSKLCNMSLVWTFENESETASSFIFDTKSHDVMVPEGSGKVFSWKSWNNIDLLHALCGLVG